MQIRFFQKQIIETKLIDGLWKKNGKKKWFRRMKMNLSKLYVCFKFYWLGRLFDWFVTLVPVHRDPIHDDAIVGSIIIFMFFSQFQCLDIFLTVHTLLFLFCKDYYYAFRPNWRSFRGRYEAGSFWSVDFQELNVDNRRFKDYLFDVNFLKMRLYRAEFCLITLSFTNFQRVDLFGANFSGSNLWKCTFLEVKITTDFFQWYYIDRHLSSKERDIFNNLETLIHNKVIRDESSLFDYLKHKDKLIEVLGEDDFNECLPNFSNVKNIETTTFDDKETKMAIIKHFDLKVDMKKLEEYEKPGGYCDRKRKEYQKQKAEQEKQKKSRAVGNNQPCK